MEKETANAKRKTTMGAELPKINLVKKTNLRNSPRTQRINMKTTKPRVMWRTRSGGPGHRPTILSTKCLESDVLQDSAFGGFLFYFKCFNLLIWERGKERQRGGGRRRERYLFHLFLYLLVGSCMFPDLGIKPATFAYWDNALTKWAITQPGQHLGDFRERMWCIYPDILYTHPARLRVVFCNKNITFLQ